MPTIVYTEGKNGQRYAYESTSYWDKNIKRPRSRRTYLGKVDENGNIMPKKTYRMESSDTPDSTINEESTTNDNSVVLNERLSSLEERVSALETCLQRVTEYTDRSVSRIIKFEAALSDALTELKEEDSLCP